MADAPPVGDESPNVFPRVGNFNVSKFGGRKVTVVGKVMKAEEVNMERNF